ncbi:ankyrin repeat-containing domain protein [Mycena olivaceomarginata]|nr:ankyrin repeat-containing domain protein [Mycena olivaceomarginata]
MAEVVGFVSAVTGLVALATQITKISYGYLLDVRDAKRTRGRYLTELSAFTDALQRAERAAVDAEQLGLLAHRPPNLSVGILNDCQTQLMTLRQTLDGDTVDGRLMRMKSALVWPLEEQQMKKQIEVLHRFRGIFADYVSASTLALSKASYSKLDILSRGTVSSHVAYTTAQGSKFTERDRSQLLEWLELPSPLHHGPPMEPPCPGTGKWFLETDAYGKTGSREVDVIVSSTSQLPAIFVLMLGSSMVLQDRTEAASTFGVVHYFCDFGAGKQQTTTLILRSLVRQMLLHGNEGHISVAKECRDRINMPLGLKDLSRAFIAMCKVQQAGPYIVFDALDELEDRKNLLPLLGEFVSAGCHIFTTSRYMPDIADALAAFEQVELEASPDDLKLFVQSELQASDFAQISFSGDIVDIIVNQADGIFLLARLLMNDLLALTTVRQIRRSLSTLPSNLTAAYQSSLNRILAQPPPRTALALRVIAWVTHAERRLKTAELVHAFAMEEGANEIDDENFVSVSMLLQVCVGLLIVNNDTTVSLIHPTAHTFFGDMPGHSIDTHRDIASTCLHYLCMHIPFGSGPCDNVSAMNTRLDQMFLLSYAAQHWGRHTHYDEKPLIPLIRKLLDNASLLESSFQALHHHRNLDPQLDEASFAALPTGKGPLHIAAYWDLKETARVYSDHDSLSLSDGQGWTPLHWACFKRSSTVSQLLLSSGAAVNAADSYGWTPLFWASFNGDTKMLTSLLDLDANHLVRDRYSWTAFQWAVSCRHQKAMEVLLNFNSNFLCLNSPQPLHVPSLSVHTAKRYHDARTMVPAEIAAETGDANLMDQLLQRLHLRTNEERWSRCAKEHTLNETWQHRYFDQPMPNLWRLWNKNQIRDAPDDFMTSRMPQYNPNVHDWRARLLHVAIRDDKIMIVRLLLELGADTNYSINGRTALHIAAFRRDSMFVSLLLKAGADPALHDQWGCTALHQALINGFEGPAATLITSGSDANERTNTPKGHWQLYRSWKANSMTPLILNFPCALHNSSFAAGGDPTLSDDSGCTALHYAVEASDLGLVRLLLQHGAKIPAPDSTGHSVIHNLARGTSHQQTLEDVQCLLDLLLEQLPEYGQSVSYLDSEVETEIKAHWAEEDWDKEIHSPLSLAMQSDNWNVVTALLIRGAALPIGQKLEPLLKKAIRELHPRATHFLLSHGVKPGGEGGCVWDLLWQMDRLSANAAARQAFALILTYLVQAGVDINTVSGGYLSGDSALLAVVQRIDVPEIVQALLDAGSNLYHTNDDGVDAFFLSLVHERVYTLSCLLHNATKTPPSGGHWTQPLHFIGPDAYQDPIAFACSCITQRNLLGWWSKRIHKTLLHRVVQNGSTNTLARLLECGVDIEEVDWYGWRPLHMAIMSGNKKVVDKLLAAGVDVCATTQKWSDYDHYALLRPGKAWTGQALYLAAMKGNAPLVAELLACGANVHAHTGTDGTWQGQGPTALHIALDTEFSDDRMCGPLDVGMLDIAAMLVQHGAKVQGVLNHMKLDDVLRFRGFEDLWDKLRGVEDENYDN